VTATHAYRIAIFFVQISSARSAVPWGIWLDCVWTFLQVIVFHCLLLSADISAHTCTPLTTVYHVNRGEPTAYCYFLNVIYWTKHYRPLRSLPRGTAWTIRASTVRTRSLLRETIELCEQWLCSTPVPCAVQTSTWSCVSSCRLNTDTCSDRTAYWL